MEFRILGPLEVVESGRSVVIRGGRQRVLLAVLLLNAKKVVSQERLIEELWGGKPPETAAKSLHNNVSALRRALGGDKIVTIAPGYLVELADDDLDSRRFERLIEQGRGERDASVARDRFLEALELWRGPALAEFAGEEFAQAEIRRLDELRLVALEGRIDADLALGGGSELVPELEALVAEHPLRERLRGQLMLALYRSGRQADALEAYRDARTTLVDELGLEPSPELQELERRILQQDSTLDAPAAAVRPAHAEPTRRSRRWIAVGVLALVLAALAAVGVVLARGGETVTVVPNSIAKIDPDSHEIVAVYPVGSNPLKPAVVGNYVFVANEDETLSRINVRSGDTKTSGRVQSPAGLTAGADGMLWVGSFDENEVQGIDVETYELLDFIKLPEGVSPWMVTVGGGSVWTSDSGLPGTVSRFSARDGSLQRRYRFSSAYAAEITYGEGAAWAAGNGVQSELMRIDAQTGGVNRIPVGTTPFSVAVGFEAVWVADMALSNVWRVDPALRSVTAVIPVGERPLGVTTGAGSVWVANSHGRTISVIDPDTEEVVDTMEVGYYPHSVAYGHGYLWVSLRAEPSDF